MNRLVTAILTLAALSIALPAGLADHCTRGRTSEPQFERDGYYVMYDVCASRDCIASAWIYEESNGIRGLQRDDPNRSDTCHGLLEPDRIVI